MATLTKKTVSKSPIDSVSDRPRKLKRTSAIYETSNGTLFVPTECAWLHHELSKPSAVLKRAGLTPGLFGKEWKQRYGNTHPWLFDWLYHDLDCVPTEAQGQGLPTPGMHAFRMQSGIEAVTEAAAKAAKENPTTDKELCTSTGPVYALLEKYKVQTWFKAWLRRGEKPPLDITVATLEQIRYCRRVWDFTSHCRNVGLGDPNTNYCRWINDRHIPDLAWLKWLYGDDPPEGAFVVSPALQRLRRERKLENICAAAHVTLAAYRKWHKRADLKNAFEAIREGVAANRSITGAGAWDKIRPETKARMGAWAMATTLASCCERAMIEVANYYQLLDKAERLGVTAALRGYLGTNLPLPPGPARCGLVALNFFIPTSGMVAFRKEALRIRGTLRRCSSVVILPGYDEWFKDWTIPPARNGRRRGLPLVAPPGALLKQRPIESSGSLDRTKPTEEIQSEGGSTATVRADKSADNKNKSCKHLPDNPDVLRLATKIDNERSTGASMNQIALDFTEGNEKRAKSLLRELRRYKHLLQ